MARIFLKENFSENSVTRYFSIDDSRIETLKVFETYANHGEQVGHYYAGDYSIFNSASSAAFDCQDAINQKFGVVALIDDGLVQIIDNVDVDYSFDTDSEFDELTKDINNFIIEWEKQNSNYSKVKGFNYFDGHNWKTVTTCADFGETSHSIIEDEDLIGELEKAIEEMEFVESGYGKEEYEGNGYAIIKTQFESDWSEYTLEKI